jgi:hypothetical protein
LLTKALVARTAALRVHILSAIGPRRRPFWLVALWLGLAFRGYAVLVLRNPMDVLFSDAARHWDNGQHFLTPGAQGASNPYLYQLYLFVLQQVTHEKRLPIGIATTVLSVFYPLVWYLFARSVCRKRVNALRFAAILCWLPSHISIFGFFMNETLVLPLTGLALWLTHRTLRTGSAATFIGGSTAWTLGVLTRSVVGPVGLVCVVVSWLRVRGRRGLALATSCAMTAVLVAAASLHAHAVLKRYTPFGDNSVVAIYFVSGAHDYAINVEGYGEYIFSSPSLYVSPFKPFADFKSIREGAVSVTLDPNLRGEDIRRTLRIQIEQNWKKLPRLIFENVVYFSFGHPWPTAGAIGDRADAICLAERWIWLPLIVISLVGSVVYVARRGVAFVPLLTIGFIFTCYVLGQVTIMEGRYRKPLEPVVLLAPIWLWDARRRA